MRVEVMWATLRNEATPGASHSAWQMVAAERDSFFGGRFDSLKVWAKPVYGAVEGHVLERGIGRVWGQEATGWRCWIVGDQLLQGQFVEYIQALTDTLREQVMLEAIAQVETGFTHFAQHAGAPCPNEDHYWGGTTVARYPWMTCDGGYGVMQLTGPPPPSRTQIWNWQANVGGGLNKLGDAGTRAALFFSRHPEYTGEITDEMWRREMYGWYNGGGYYDWKQVSPGSWEPVPQSIQCDCDGNERKGRLINSQGELGDVCRTRGRCYADYIFNHNAEDW